MWEETLRRLEGLLGEPLVALDLLEVGRMPSSRGVVDQGPMRL